MSETLAYLLLAAGGLAFIVAVVAFAVAQVRGEHEDNVEHGAH